MAMPWDLEDWLTETGDRIVNKIADSGKETLTAHDCLIYEIWVFDIETRNGGVSQYFGNRGLEQWESLRSASQGFALPSLMQFMQEVDRLCGDTPDPYAVALAASPPLEEAYWRSHQTGIVDELRNLCVGSD